MVEPVLDPARAASYLWGMKFLRPLTIIAALGVPLAAPAHPHVFVDTQLHFQINDKAEVTGVEMVWSYDDFFSLLIFEDMGLDKDGDGALTQAELEQLMGFDLIEWPAGFEGDLYLASAGRKIAMERPRPTGIASKSGRITSTQYRPIPNVPVKDLVIRQYDPTFYVAYNLDGRVSAPDGCEVQVNAADLDAAAQAKQNALDTIPEDQFEEMEIGIHYADEVRITCDGLS